MLDTGSVKLIVCPGALFADYQWRVSIGEIPISDAIVVYQWNQFKRNYLLFIYCGMVAQ